MTTVERPSRQPRKLLCIGLPEAGKTTFLVALYHVVESGEVAGSLELEKGTLFETDREYIQSQREKWLNYAPVERNKTDAKGPILLSLVDCSAGCSKVHLDLPDLSGEAFRMQVEDRIMSRALRDKVGACDGLLLFINPESVSEPITIAEVDAALGDVPTDPEREIGDSGDEDAEEPDIDFSPDKFCTAVKLVELLQFLKPYCSVRPIALAVVISAFDLLAKTPYRDDPAKYLAEKLALLSQYLQSNSEIFAYSVFGVSAQGVAYKNAEDMAAHAGKGAAAERIRVQPVPPTGAHDITHVIRWLVQAAEGGASSA